MRRAVMWWVWLCAVTVLLARGAAACRLGGRISGRMECGVAGSPYTVTQDVEVSRGASLVFRPGVTVMFDPGVGMTVRGTLEAEGTELQRITFTSSQPPAVQPPAPALRLVDGPTPMQGRLQIFYKDEWRSICTNSRNWTAADMGVACRQLGFSGGKYWEWQDRANNDTKTLLYQAPRCSGLEGDITKCAWQTHAMGGGVCDMHPDLGVDCDPYHALWRGTNHWRGIHFQDAEYEGQLFQNTLYQKVSKSVLSYVDIEYAGMGPQREVVSAVMTRRVPPRLRHVTVTNSAFNGINVTLPGTFLHLEHAVLKENAGHGLYVNTSTGSVLVDRSSEVADNQADGIKYNFHHREPDKSASDTFQDFCAGASNLNQAYPVVIVATQDRLSHNELNCEKHFVIRDTAFVFTVHFSYMQAQELNAGTVEVRDRDKDGRVLTKFDLRNNTFPPSVVSRGNRLWIKVTAKPRQLSFIFMEVVASKYKMYDLSLRDSMVRNNSGHGVAIDYMRSLVHVHRSNLTHNYFGSGLNVRQGAGDVNVTHSTIMHNIGDGVNITYEGGLQNVTWSTVAANKLRGMAVWFNESGQNTGIHQETAVAYSTVSDNFDVGLRVGNFCRASFINISSNTFAEGRAAALEIESCWKRGSEGRTVQIGQNMFRENRRLAVKISPAVNMNLTIEYNEFNDNHRGTVLIYNEDKVELPVLPFLGMMNRNNFRGNTGWYVLRLGLSLRGLDQSMRVERNIIKGNTVEELFPAFHSRSRASGVVCVASSNIILYRNLLENPDSRYELASHTTDQSNPIVATHNWLGSKFEREIFRRILDRRDLYNLALVQFHPYLLSDNNVETPVMQDGPESEPEFFDPSDSHIIGGEVNGEVTLRDGLYTVTRDIYVHKTGTLTIAFGTTLEFAEGMGMMVAGLLRTEGSGSKDVKFTLQGTTAQEEVLERAAYFPEEEGGATALNVTGNETLTEVHTLNLTREGDEAPTVPFKLMGGRDSLEGRLMVWVDGQWGTVCNHGWNQDAAAIVCHQMGLVLNPEDWDLQPSQLPSQGQTNPILLSNVQCDEFDTDFTKCRSDHYWELENSCTHNEDVGLRCYPGSWAGIRLGMTAHESHMKGVIIEKAGLFDYTTRTFKPALQIDFHHHVIQDVEVRNNLQDGVGVMYSNQYAITNPSARVFQGCTFSGNRRHGITLKQLGVNITASSLQRNDGSGLHFNPFVSRAEQRELAGWLKLQQDKYYTIPDGPKSMRLETNLPQYFITKTLRGSDVRATIVISTSHSNVIGIQVLNPISPDSTEQLVIYDYQEVIESQDIARWDLRGDQVAFPTTSSTYAITIDYSSGPFALGDIILLLTAVDRRDIAQAGDLRNFRAKWPLTYIDQTRIKNNDIGISTLHYNRYLTDDGDHLLRCANESIMVVGSQITNNQNQAFYALSPFRVRMDNNDMAEITFMFNRTTISGNGRGIDQYSWDIRESNNLFHWVLEEVVMENNGGGGVALALPYVWQYTENFTHTVFVNASTFRDNAQFSFVVDGHFARFNMTHSVFERNVCQRGLLSVQGMEKEMFIHNNRIESNMGSYMVEFNTNSQSGILGSVFAYFEYNRVQNNKPVSITRSSASRAHQPDSYTVAVRGLQKVNITHNLLGYNKMNYELLAGLYSSRVNNYLNAEANWWGTRQAQEIEELIFDFDDWNNFALADYLPYLIDDSISARVSSVGSSAAQETTDLTQPLGGRLLHDLRLPRRSEPYIVKADLTVMPGVALVVEAGATLEFFPSVGLLVLGRLDAVGTKDKRIIMRPVDPNRAMQSRGRRHVKTTLEAVRLCVEGECDNRSEGFLDIYNGTTKQWVPICDDRFTERNAEVVCRQLGHNIVNTFHGRNKRTEMFPNALIRVRSWPDPIQCEGTENALNECSLRMNGQIFDHTYDCPWNGDFVYISCGDLNLQDPEMDYWGGIRFSIPNFEHTNIYNRIHDSEAPHHAHAHPLVHGEPHTPIYPSLLEWVEVIGAGILHNDKSPAILSFHETPHLRGVTVRDSAYDGLTLISATYGFEMLYNRFENNLGVGVTLLGLTGETRETEESSFYPLGKVRLPYHTFGMVDMCDSTKELRIEERVLLYYKYDNRPVDCIKIFSSVFNVKNFGFRLLHMNLYDSTFAGASQVHDRLVLYDGDIYNYTTQAFAEISARSGNHMRFFKTAGTSLSVELHATGASGDLGFVAEVVSLPISDLGINRNILQNFTYNEYYNNVEGAIFAATAGEVNPWLCFAYSRLEHNGRQLYGNFTTTRAAVHLDVQNIQDVYFKNNLVHNNTGGLYIYAGSIGAATKLQANVTNNLFVGTKHWQALYMASRENSAYQHALIAYNDFSWSLSPYHDVITLAQVVSVFTHNYAHSNIGRHILDIYGFQKVRLPVYQTTSHNSLAKNVARDPTYQGTIIAGSAGQQFVDNVFYNWDNAYELVAVNESVRCNISTECTDTPGYRVERVGVVEERSDVWKTPIDARSNWWGFNTSVAVSGRIHDKTDDETLLHVDYSNWKKNNFSLLQGCEPGYTLIGDSCYLYIGAPVTHQEAKEFCRRDNASLPFLQKWYWEVQHWLKDQQPEYLWESDMVWVQHLDVIRGCAAFVYRQVRSVDCNLKLPFICESDADETIDRLAWASDPLAVAAIAMTMGCLILVAACVSCWACKSRERRKERIIRRNSIRASIRSNRSAISTSTTTGGFSDLTRRRIIEDPQRAMPMKGQEAVGGAARMNGLSGSFDSIAKSGLNSSLDEDPSYVVYEETTPSIPPGYSSHLDDSFGQHSFTTYGHSPSLPPLHHHQPVGPFPPPPTRRDFLGESYQQSASTPLVFQSDPLWSFQGGASSLQPEESSLRGSTMQLAGSSITTDSTLEMKKEPEDPHLAATLPRDQAPPFQYMSVNALPSGRSHSDSDDSTQGYFSGRSQSQPLETAM
ncbi:protein bark beetle-like isoform X5 [Eriocheir sinensis]|uniref:protein bark beetle-like isoform X5 n=1 Tax=Eriocheir sinensis TaxID=95602 RepID=UPI0021C8E25B|nr:protein bark beetle-like isoform X5 [Eriocheir sinensis]